MSFASAKLLLFVKKLIDRESNNEDEISQIRDMIAGPKTISLAKFECFNVSLSFTSAIIEITFIRKEINR